MAATGVGYYIKAERSGGYGRFIVGKVPSSSSGLSDVCRVSSAVSR